MSDTLFIECKICFKQFKNLAGLGSHITRFHDITKSEYYLKYIDNTEPLCKNCGNVCNFLNLQKGFNIYCSCKCANSNEQKILNWKLNNIKKYGVDNTSKLDSVKSKHANTCLEKYGAVTNLITDEQKSDTKNKLIEHYGVDSPVKSKIIQNKMRNTCIKRYGKPAYSQTDEFKLFMSDYNIKNPILHKTAKYKYNDEYFDSSWEVAYYIWLKDHDINFIYHPKTYFYYEFNGKQKRYEPDFQVNDEFIEIKGDQFIDKDNNLINPYNDNKNLQYKAKLDCMIKNSIKILKRLDMLPIFCYIKEKYGKNYIKQFKICQTI